MDFRGITLGLTQPQLGGYNSYIHGQPVGHGNARVLVQTCLVVISLLYLINDEVTTTIDAVGTFVIWSEFLLVHVNAPVSYFSTLFVYDMFFVYIKLVCLTL